MAGSSFIDSNGNPVHMDFSDAYGEATINGTVWRWEYHRYLGPGFLRKDGELRKCQCPTVKAVWDAFYAWLENYNNKIDQ